MKKLFAGIILLVFVAFTGCSDDDEMNEVNHLSISQTILGKWQIEGGTVNGGAFENYVHPCIINKNYQEFTADGIVRFVGHNQDCEENEIHQSSYTINNNTLTVHNENDPVDDVFIIPSLTSMKLLLKQTVNTPEGVETIISHFSKI